MNQGIIEMAISTKPPLLGSVKSLQQESVEIHNQTPELATMLCSHIFYRGVKDLNF